MPNRRDFCTSLLAVPALTSGIGMVATADRQVTPEITSGFPLSDYTPYGYLDNPFHCWNLHRSGVLRSSPGIGFGFYFPAGPGGYFDFARNGVYEAHLRIGFVVNGRRFWSPDDFRAGQLTSPYHSKNLQMFAFSEGNVRVESTFLQVSEDTLAAKVAVQGTRPELIRIVAALDCKLGGAAWWGRDGLVGSYDPKADCVSVRSFAAGKVFVLRSDFSSEAHFAGQEEAELLSWLMSPSKIESGPSYHPKPLCAALLFSLPVRPGTEVEHRFVLSRGDNLTMAQEESRRALAKVEDEWTRKHTEDAVFWSAAPRLEGDWPDHWKHGWIYDFETLRMMVRRPVGNYKHLWDPMQIQAPRTVLAESSIDMWALSYADPVAAKAVVYGLFANAPSEGVPCSREDGEMNMVAADGAECGTSISWCYPFFCAASIWTRNPDKQWLAKLYPRMARFLRWTLRNRTDAGGFVIGKCSWETGMDTSTRFLIQQPTGGELIEFLRIVELQAATSQAAGVLLQFAEELGDTELRGDWRKIQQEYAAKTQTLWKDDWFYDFDTRNGQLVTTLGRDVGQVGPIFCGIATDEQKKKMRPALHKFFSDSMAGQPSTAGTEDWRDELHWSSLVLPYVESLWSAGELELLSEVVHAIADRVYTSMDRRSVANASSESTVQPAPKLGWPGISCEVWGAQGAYGGEGYGWGAVLPAHIIRNLIGFRDPTKAGELPLSPNLPDSFMVSGKTYRVVNLGYRGSSLDLTIGALNSRQIRVEGKWSQPFETISVKDITGDSVPLRANGSAWQFDGNNHQQYFIRIANSSKI